MKYVLALALALLLMFALAACGGGRDNGDPNITDNPPDSPAGSSFQNPSEGLTDEPEDEITEGWPTSTLYNIPELNDIIEIRGYLGSFDESAGSSRLIEVEVMDESLEEWLDALRDAGYTVESGKNNYGSGMVHNAKLGPVHIRVSESGYTFQIEFNFMVIGSWLDDDLPGFLIQIPGKTVIGAPKYYIPGDDIEGRSGMLADETGYNFQFIYDGLTAEEAVKYMEDVAAKLKNADFDEEGTYLYFGHTLCIHKGIYNWNGQNYYVYGEVMMADDSTFEFYFGWSQNDMGL